ncbi:glycosyltransferase [Prevotella aurantiaca]
MMNEELKKQLKSRRICVVIPTYNNDKTIKAVVEQSLHYCDDIIVVADGCTDNTMSLLHDIDNIKIVAYPQNKGKGYALKTGFKKALEEGFSYAITLDGDGQHYPEDIPHFLKANQEHPHALIVGNRQLEGVDRSKGSSFANKFSNFWFYIQTGKALADTQTGYRLYPLRKLHGLSLLTSRYEAELELLVFASWHGTKIVSIPVQVYYPPRAERVSHFRPGKDFARISVLNTVLCFLAIVYGLPLRLWRALMIFVRTTYSLLFFLFFTLLVFSPFVWIYTKLFKMTEKRRYRLHQLIYHASRFVMIHHGIPGTKYQYKVPEDIDFNKPRIIICNHQSHLDLMCQLVFSPKIIFLTNVWVWNNPFYGSLIRNAEYLPVKEGLEEIMPHLRSLIERGYSIAVYPEGTRSKDCRIGRFHQGAFYMAQEFGLEILPMYLYGPGKILPKTGYRLHKGKFFVEVGEPLTQDELLAMGDLRQQASEMRKRYKKKYEDIANKMER